MSTIYQAQWRHMGVVNLHSTWHACQFQPLKTVKSTFKYKSRRWCNIFPNYIYKVLRLQDLYSWKSGIGLQTRNVSYIDKFVGWTFLHRQCCLCKCCNALNFNAGIKRKCGNLVCRPCWCSSWKVCSHKERYRELWVRWCAIQNDAQWQVDINLQY